MKKLFLLGIAFLSIMALETINAQPKTGKSTSPPTTNTEIVKPQTDTQRIIMQVSDTAIIRTIDSVSRKELSRRYDPGVFWIFGYVVREKHNTAEGVEDAASQVCVDQSGKQIPCFQDYWKPIMILDQRKKPLPPSIVIWQTSLLN